MSLGRAAAGLDLTTPASTTVRHIIRRTQLPRKVKGGESMRPMLGASSTDTKGFVPMTNPVVLSSHPRPGRARLAVSQCLVTLVSRHRSWDALMRRAEKHSRRNYTELQVLGARAQSQPGRRHLEALGREGTYLVVLHVHPQKARSPSLGGLPHVPARHATTN